MFLQSDGDVPNIDIPSREHSNVFGWDAGSEPVLNASHDTVGFGRIVVRFRKQYRRSAQRLNSSTGCPSFGDRANMVWVVEKSGEMIRHRDDLRRRSVIAGQMKHARPGEVFSKPADVLGLGTTKPVDGLTSVTNHPGW